MSIGHAFKRARNACSAVAIGALVSSGGGASDLRIMEAKRTGRIIVGLAGEAVGVRRRFGCHANLRGNAGFVRNAVPAALQADALIPAASPGAAAPLISAPAPEREHVAIFSCDDRAGGIMPRLPF